MCFYRSSWLIRTVTTMTVSILLRICTIWVFVKVKHIHMHAMLKMCYFVLFCSQDYHQIFLHMYMHALLWQYYCCWL